MGKKEDIPAISATNTKKEMLEAYNALRERFEAMAREELLPEKAKQKRQTDEVVAVADALSTEKANEAIQSLKTEVSAVLSDIADKMEKATGRYTKIKEAMAAKGKELEELFEIEKSAYSLAALLEAQKQKRLAFEEEMASRRSELEEEIRKTRTAWESEKGEYTARLKEQKDEDLKLRKREQEEYTYKYTREKEQKTNALKDELEKLERELAAQKEEFEKATAVKKMDIDAREEAVTHREKELDKLQARVESFPAELESAVKKAVQEVTGRLTAEASKNEELLRKTYEGEKNVLSTRIQSSEHLAAEQKKQIEILTAQIDKAYGKVQDIAVKAVSSTRERPYAEPAARSPQQVETKESR